MLFGYSTAEIIYGYDYYSGLLIGEAFLEVGGLTINGGLYYARLPIGGL